MQSLEILCDIRSSEKQSSSSSAWCNMRHYSCMPNVDRVRVRLAENICNHGWEYFSELSNGAEQDYVDAPGH
jgi:hypothetical protein